MWLSEVQSITHYSKKGSQLNLSVHAHPPAETLKVVLEAVLAISGQLMMQLKLVLSQLYLYLQLHPSIHPATPPCVLLNREQSMRQSGSGGWGLQ